MNTSFKKLSSVEMKSLVGGEAPAGSHICGTRYWAGLCYCDYCNDKGLPVECESPCYWTNCSASGIIY